MNLWRVCTALQISLQDILYLCHKPCREDRDGCFLYWADGLMVIISLVFPPFSILSTILSFNFLQLSYSSGRRQPSAVNHTMLWIKCCSTDLQPCKHTHTQMMAADKSQSLVETKTSQWAKHIWRIWKCNHPGESQRAYIQAKTHASKTNKENQCFDIWHSKQVEIKWNRFKITIIIHGSQKNPKETVKTSWEHFKKLPKRKVTTLIVAYDNARCSVNLRDNAKIKPEIAAR